MSTSGKTPALKSSGICCVCCRDDAEVVRVIVEPPPSDARDCHDVVFRMVGGGGGLEILLVVGDGGRCVLGGRGNACLGPLWRFHVTFIHAHGFMNHRVFRLGQKVAVFSNIKRR